MTILLVCMYTHQLKSYRQNSWNISQSSFLVGWCGTDQGLDRRPCNSGSRNSPVFKPAPAISSGLWDRLWWKSSMLILTKHTPETTLRAAHFRFVFCYFVFCILQLVSLMKPLCLKTRFRHQVLCDNWNGKQFNKNADFSNIEQWTVAKDSGHPCSLPLPLHLEVTLYF